MALPSSEAEAPDDDELAFFVATGFLASQPKHAVRDATSSGSRMQGDWHFQYRGGEAAAFGFDRAVEPVKLAFGTGAEKPSTV